MEFGRSAFKHGFARDEIVVDLDPDSGPPNVLAIGVDPPGRWLEVTWWLLADRDVVIHAMRLRNGFMDLAEEQGD